MIGKAMGKGVCLHRYRGVVSISAKRIMNWSLKSNSTKGTRDN